MSRLSKEGLTFKEIAKNGKITKEIWDKFMND